MSALNRRERRKRRGKRKWQLLAKSQLLSGFAFESQAAIGTKGRTEITIAGEIVTLPSVTEPDAAQSVLLNHLGMNLPRRLRRLDELAQM